MKVSELLRNPAGARRLARWLGLHIDGYSDGHVARLVRWRGFTCSTNQVIVYGEILTVLQVANPDTCPHCTLPVAECECHERGRD